MRKKICRLLSFVATAALLQTSAFGNWTVSGYNILLDGQDFEIKGVCYQPTPIGESGALDPFGDYYTLSTRNQEIWDRDFVNFRKMGVNVIRLYGWNPEADHTDFLSQAYNGGDEPIYVLINQYINPETDWTDTGVVDGLVANWQDIATELATNPAVMGFLIGNEVNAPYNSLLGDSNGNLASFWDAMERIADAVKTIAPTKLVSVAITDAMGQVAAFNAAMDKFDFWAMQLYRGNSFNALFTEYADAVTENGTTTADIKPLVITEFGYDALDGRIDEEWPNNAELPANAMEALLNELRVDDAADDVVAGVCVFEYADEWWKDQASGNLTIQDFGPRWGGAFEDGQGNEEWWGIFRVVDDGTNIDILEPRAMFYRIASMWNPPFETVLQTSLASTDLQVSFAYPTHLRDQSLILEMSTDLSDWTPVGNNIASLYLNSMDSSVAISSTVVNDEVQVTVVKDPSSVGEQNLVTNGGFETGDLAAWTGFASASDLVAKEGTYSLEISTGAGTVQVAFQEIPVAPGDEINLSGYMYTESPLPPNATFGLFKIVFKDADSQDLLPASISVGASGPEGFPGAESRPLLDFTSSIQTWIFSETQAVAPANTVKAEIFALNVADSAAVLNFDSIIVEKIPSSTPANPTVFFQLQNNGR